MSQATSTHFWSSPFAFEIWQNISKKQNKTDKKNPTFIEPVSFQNTLISVISFDLYDPVLYEKPEWPSQFYNKGQFVPGGHELVAELVKSRLKLI